jgi:hypothetical protein
LHLDTAPGAYTPCICSLRIPLFFLSCEYSIELSCDEELFPVAFALGLLALVAPWLWFRFHTELLILLMSRYSIRSAASPKCLCG